MDEKQVSIEISNAIECGELDALTALIDDDKRRLALTTPFGTWLHIAAMEGELEIVQWLLAKGADINARGGIMGGGPLESAASNGHLDVVRLLVKNGAELDVSEPESNPLFGAILEGHTEVAEFLIKSGIDTNVKYTGDNMNEMDALAFAKEWDRSEIIELLESV